MRQVHSMFKDGRIHHYDSRAQSLPLMAVVRSKTQVVKDGEVTEFVSVEEKPIEDYAKTLGIPDSRDFQLRDMLKAGILPEQVNTEGLLDSQDPLDSRNLDQADGLFNKLIHDEPVVESPVVQASADVVVDTPPADAE